MNWKTASTLVILVAVALAGCDLAGMDGSQSLPAEVSADLYEPDDTKGAATNLPESASGIVRTWQEHTIHPSSDVDWIEFTTGAITGNLYVEIRPNPSADPSQGVGNIDFRVEDAGGGFIFEGVSPFGNSTESNVHTAGVAAGTYYIRVLAADSSTGIYQISWYSD